MSIDQWTAIIPAAGTGSRLNSGEPKILYPILGKPILHWLVDALKESCSRFVFVVSPSGQFPIRKALFGLLPSARFQLVVQEKPLGMADAVDRARDYVHTANSLVVWGDQVTLKPETVQACMRIHTSAPGILATVPTAFRKNAYIHFERSPNGQIARVLEAREGASIPELAESDCGVFLFNTQALFATIEKARGERQGMGMSTREFNFVPLLPLFERAPGSVMSARIVSEEETLGVNTASDAAEAERILRQRGTRRTA